MKYGTVLMLTVLPVLSACKEKPAIEPFARPSGGEDFDHRALGELFGKYVNEEGDVDYSSWKKEPGDFKKLEAYLAAVGKVAPSRMSLKEAEAFWINLYNALTIRAVLEFYPLKSIKDKISDVPGVYNLWDDYKIKVEGRDLSLNDIEHRILRKMGDPRIHFALVCAAKSCPRLRGEAYEGEKLDAQLDENARHFFARPKHFRLDREKKTASLSSILDWFKEDFGKGNKDRLVYAARFMKPEDQDFLKKNEVAVQFLEYDWALNDQSPKAD